MVVMYVEYKCVPSERSPSPKGGGASPRGVGTSSPVVSLYAIATGPITENLLQEKALRSVLYVPAEGLGTRWVNSLYELAFASPRCGGRARCGAHTSGVDCSFALSSAPKA